MTEHNEEMNLYPSMINLVSPTGNITLDDNAGINISTKHPIFIKGSEINFIAPYINVVVQIGEINLVKLNAVQVSVLSSFTMSNQFDVLADDVTKLVGWDFVAYAMFDDAPEEKGFDWGILGNFLLGALAVVALVALTTLTGGVGTAMLFGAAVAVGTATVVMTVEDLVRGEARSVGEAVRTLMISAVCGAIGGVLPGGTLIANGMAGAIEGTVERTLNGEETTWEQLEFDFAISALTGGVLDGVGRAFSKRAAKKLADKAAKELAKEATEKATKELADKAAKEATEKLAKEVAEKAVRDAEAALGGGRFGERKISNDEYNELRTQTPTREIRDMVNEDIEDLIGELDEALGLPITGRLEADHIVPMNNIARMDGFHQLTKDQQIEILNNLDNFYGLTKSANASKGSKTYEEWTKHISKNIDVNTEFRERMIAVSKEIEGMLQLQIDNFLK